MSTTQDENVPASVVLIINLTTIAIFLVFIQKFIRIKEKSCTHHFLIILNISAMLYPILNANTVITVAYTNKTFNIHLFGPIVAAIYMFNMTWSAAFAIYTYLLYKSVQQCQIFNYKKFTIIALTSCISLSSVFPIMNYAFNFGENMNFKINGMYSIKYSPQSFTDKAFSFIWLDLIGLTLPISLNVLFFSKVQSLVKSSFETQNLAIWRYPVATIICFIPGVILDVVVGLSGIFYPFWLSVTCNLLHRAWAFINIWVYWDLVGKNDNAQEDLFDEEHEHSRFSLSSSQSFRSRLTTSKEDQDHHVMIYS